MFVKEITNSLGLKTGRTGQFKDTKDKARITVTKGDKRDFFSNVSFFFLIHTHGFRASLSHARNSSQYSIHHLS